MLKKTLILILLFLVVRGYTLYIYEDYYYYYGSFSSQFAIANAMYHGHPFSADVVNTQAVVSDAAKKNKYIPLEAWKNYPISNQYMVFPATDLPGFGYLIAYTSQYFDHALTAKYAFGIQLLMELLSLLGFLYCVFLILGERTAFIAGLLYIFVYPYIWPIATQPSRDMFALGSFSAVLLAFFLFYFRKGWCVWLVIVSLLASAAIFLWIKPTNYYYFFFILPLVFFVKHRTLKEKIMFFLCMVLIPISLFGEPYKFFNLKYYGVTDTCVLGRGIWEGLGVVENNPYGFVLNDMALVPFVEQHFHKKVVYGSIAMNKYLSDYVVSVLKQDPIFYFKAITIHVRQLLKSPLIIEHPTNAPGWMLNPSGKLFFYLGLWAALLALFYLKNIRMLSLLLLSPLLYNLSWEIAINMEQRITATAAWILIFPLAWLFVFGSEKLQDIKRILINWYQMRK